MTEKPILFSAPMVKAILAGTKTQTRREVKRPERYEGGLHNCLHCCPYGAPGDQLWVRETFATRDFRDEQPSVERRRHYTIYRADSLTGDWDDGHFHDFGHCWRPSIFMPRWASRITLEVTDVRVERLQSISAKDIISEGAVERAHDDQFGHNPVSRFDGRVYLDLQSLWAHGWESINGKGSWALNPWVWVVAFRLVAR